MNSFTSGRTLCYTHPGALLRDGMKRAALLRNENTLIEKLIPLQEELFKDLTDS